ncbi:MAG: lysophospholipid acyltransferase family protein [Acidobacteriota bacterium]
MSHRDPQPTASGEPRVVRALARIALDIFYRRVEVEGAEHVPRDGAAVFVGNHASALLDPALFVAYLPRTPRFLAKSTLWDNPVVRPFLGLAAAIPVYRRQDAVDPANNAATFERCHDVLATDGAIALFPEGTSHDGPSLLPLKTGMARIVLQALDRFPEATIRIVPVGFVFDDKTRFRSRVLIHVGEPIDPAEEAARYAAAGRKGDPNGDSDGDDEARRAVLDLTERVREALEGVTLNYPSWEEATLIDHAARIWARPNPDVPSERPMAEMVPVRRLFAEGYATLLERFPERIHAVAEQVRRYDQQLDLYRLRDEQVASAYPPGTVLRFTVKSLVVLLVRLPLGALGIVLHAPSYHLVDVLARRFSPSSDSLSTYKVFAGLFVYPPTWGLLAGLAGWWAGLWAGLGALILGPLSGLYAIRFLQRKDVLFDQARAFLLLRSGRRGIDALRRQRERVLAAVGELVDEWRASTER